jgi:hypothetical protein
MRSRDVTNMASILQLPETKRRVGKAYIIVADSWRHLSILLESKEVLFRWLASRQTLSSLHLHILNKYKKNILTI